MSTTTPVSDPATEPKAPSERGTRAEWERLRPLLPTDTVLMLVVGASVVAVVASFSTFGFTGYALLGAVFCPTLILLAAIDAKHKLLPNAIILPGSLAIGLIVAATSPGDFLAHLAAGAALGAFFFLFGTIFSGSLGMGDAKLGFLIGLALAEKTLGATLVAFFGLLIAALYVLATRGTSARKDAIPFGPFLALGGILAYFFA